ncbi:IclR family transcriptional regulator [Rhodococcus gannanensis]|uniref:IclR family transcriptional regulator n=1 Tax=Rhodococcus gannanensis TaxID=1960308 RepID=A0ABW4P4J9_9NOCA
MSVDTAVACVTPPMTLAEGCDGSAATSPDRRTGSERTVLGRVASIMDAFSGSRQVLSLGDLSECTGLPKSTLHRLADQLCQVGWISRAPGGYRIGMRMFELGSLALDTDTLQDTASPHLRSLATRTGLHVQLSVPDGAEVVHLERVAAGPLHHGVRRGERTPAYCTALGKAMAASDDHLEQSVLSAPMPRRTGNTITDRGTLLVELHRIRSSGIAIDRSEYRADVVCVAAPILQGQNVVAAVSVTAIAGRMRGDAAATAVLTTASAITNAISSRQHPGHA